MAVVIDAAASFDTVTAAAVPAVVSLHATKAMGIGEGGFVTAVDPALIDQVRQRANFGFWNSREAAVPALNGKISEYAAGIGLAALDRWPDTRAALARVCGAYRAALDARTGVTLQLGFADRWLSSTVTVAVRGAGTAGAVGRRLAAAGIGSRRWWGGGLHRHAAFSGFPRGATPVTDALAEAVIGLPCWLDLSDEAIARVCAIVLEVGGGTGCSGMVAEPCAVS